MDRGPLAGTVARRVRLGRRQFLGGALALGATRWPRPLTRRAGAQPKFTSVARSRWASPPAIRCPHGVVLWTRLAPEPLHRAAACRPDVVVVDWEVAERRADAAASCARHRAATPEWATRSTSRSTGSSPARWYWYRFRAGGEVSPVGRTRTAPAVDAPLERLRFAFASCQHYEQGYYGAYHHMAGDDLDLRRLPRRLHLRIVLGPGPRAQARRAGAAHARGLPHPPRALQDRPRPAGRRTRPARGSSPGTTTRSTTTTRTIARSDAHPREWFLRAPRRRLPGVLRAHAAAALHGPARSRTCASTTSSRSATCRASTCSTTASTARTSPARGPGRGGSTVVEDCAERLDPQLTLLGEVQEQLARDEPRPLARPLERDRAADAHGAARPQAGPGQQFWTDGWDGYPAARRRLLDSLGHAQAGQPGRDRRRRARLLRDRPQARLRRPEVAGGGRPSSSAPRSPRSSAGRSRRWTRSAGRTRTCAWPTALAAATCAIDVDAAADCRPSCARCATVTQPRAEVDTLATFVVEDGRTGAVRRDARAQPRLSR